MDGVVSPYWAETDQQIKTANNLDRLVAQAMNMEWILVNKVPFGHIIPLSRRRSA